MKVVMRVDDAEYVVRLIDELLKTEFDDNVKSLGFMDGWNIFGETLKKYLTSDITQDINL